MREGKDRREERFHFLTLEALLEHYSGMISDDQMQDIVLDAARDFNPRAETTDERSRLQFIRKCELAMDTVAELKREGVW